ncbi:response regulator transcription factor [Actinoplanes sp. NEAU-A12]|uniref:Response regulator transcription factor n=1 Tax=Actinoplanes sandaracinus TaxID=3045177 RepID=A0ABT6WZH4_9ACTN|nr:response regulator transcription factor [Actinoplanes sandaracinus]MDI6105146.1 response regulator transcription factor [Actinoplanes sandaracinus]
MADIIRVLLVDDDPLVRVGLSLLLSVADDVEVVSEASDGAQAVDIVQRLRPDVVLMDIRMPGMDGLTATEALRARGDDCAIIVLTTFDTDEYVLRALRLGANGFLLKDTPPRQILDSVRRVAAGESMLSASVINRLIEHVVRTGGQDEKAKRSDRSRAALDALNDREREVAIAISKGRSNAEIGSELHMSLATVKACVSQLLTKLDCVNRVQIAILVHEARN